MPLEEAARFLRRIARMSSHEIRTRAGQEASKRIDRIQYAAGASFAETPQPGAHVRQFFFPQGRSPEGMKSMTVDPSADRLLQKRFDLLGFEDLSFGDPVDWHFDPVHGKRSPRRPWYKIPYLDFKAVGDHKIIWELSRHQHLVTLAKAYRITGRAAYRDEALSQWEHWLEENPYPIGINWASNLEVAFRALSWIWLWHLLLEQPGTPDDFASTMKKALAVSARHLERYLSTYFAPNTHLIGEALALFSIGLLCPEFPSSSRWRDVGWQIVVRQADVQVRKDGFYFEQSTYYHVYALDMFLHARILAARNGIKIPPEFDAVLVRMLDLLRDLGQSGMVVQMGDDDGGRLFDPRRNRQQHLLDPLAVGALVYNRSDYRAAVPELTDEAYWLTGDFPDVTKKHEKADSNTAGNKAAKVTQTTPASAPPHSAAFRDSGIYVMVSDSGRASAFLDVGPQGEGNSGHAHADALSFQLVIDGHPWLADSGTGSYMEHDTRSRLRATAAHNTLVVDRQDQAVSSNPFAWTYQPTVTVDRWIAGDRFDWIAAHHNGYERLAQPATHHRSVLACKCGLWAIHDLVEGLGEHHLEIRWHLASDLQAEPVAPGTFRIQRPSTNQEMFAVFDGQGWSAALDCSPRSPVYGKLETGPVMTFSAKGRLPAEFTLMLVAPGL